MILQWQNVFLLNFTILLDDDDDDDDDDDGDDDDDNDDDEFLFFFNFLLFIYLFNLYLKLTKTSRIHIAGHLHKNITTQSIYIYIKKQTLCPLFMDGVQLPQG